MEDAGSLELGDSALSAANEDPSSRPSTEALRLGLDVAGVGIGMVDYAADAVVLDARAGALWELPANRQIARRELHARFHPEDAPDLMQAVMSLIGPDGDSEFAAEHRIVLPGDRVRWIAVRKRVQYDGGIGPARRATSGLLAVRDVSDRHHRDETRRLLVLECEHRIKNAFTMLASMVRLSAAASKTPGEMRDSLIPRLEALAGAFGLVAAGTSETAGTAGTTLAQVLESSLRPFSSIASERVAFVGPAVEIGRDDAMSLALAFHELATNSVKYGALAVAEGTLRVEWAVQAGTVRIAWMESGAAQERGPVGSAGLGSRLIEATLCRQLGGTLDRRWNARGLAILICLPLRSATQ